MCEDNRDLGGSCPSPFQHVLRCVSSDSIAVTGSKSLQRHADTFKMTLLQMILSDMHDGQLVCMQPAGNDPQEGSSSCQTFNMHPFIHAQKLPHVLQCCMLMYVWRLSSPAAPSTCSEHVFGVSNTAVVLSQTSQTAAPETGFHRFSGALETPPCKTWMLEDATHKVSVGLLEVKREKLQIPTVLVKKVIH